MWFRKKRIDHDKMSSLREWIESIAVAVYFVLIVRMVLIQSFRIPTPSMVDTLKVGDFLFVERLAYGPRVAYHVGDEELWNIHLPGYSQPRIGDIVVFRYPIDGRDFVKRCIGLPQDTVMIRSGQVYVNGIPLDEPYVKFSYDPYPPPSWADTADPQFWDQYQQAWEQRELMDWLSEFLINRRFTDPDLPRSNREFFQMLADNFGPVVIPEDHYFVMGDNRQNSDDARFWGPLPEKELRGRPLILYFSFSTEDDQEQSIPFWRWIKWNRIGRLVRS